MTTTIDISLRGGIDIIKDYVKHLSSAPGVYRMLSSKGEVLYVGKAKNLKKRVASYTQPQRLPLRLQRMVSLTATMEFVITHTEGEALLLESNLIKSLGPRFNVLLKDDKSFPYILLTDHPKAPEIVMHRGAKTRLGDYFGPFASRQSAYQTLEILIRVFKLRTCTDNTFNARKRPCLQYYIKKCSAPCVDLVSQGDYLQSVKAAREFLQGKTHLLQEQLAQRMEEASQQMHYEKAAIYRDQIKSLTQIQQQQDIHVQDMEDVHVIVGIKDHGKVSIQVFFFRHGSNYGNCSYFPSHDKNQALEEVLEAFVGLFYADKKPPRELLTNVKLPEQTWLQQALTEKAGHKVKLTVPMRGPRAQVVQGAVHNAREALARKLAEQQSQTAILEQLKDLFGLPETPQRIEVYDNSHLQGTNAYGVMIVANGEGFDKKAYRKFKIQEAAPDDDYAMMREVLQRRFRNAEEGPLPDLILLDGGKGQLSSGQEVLDELGLDLKLVAVAKGPDRNAGREKFFLPGQADHIEIDHTSPLIYYLQRLRDEAHRFAIGTHRAKRIKDLSRSQLDDIPGIGAVRKKALLHHFGSFRHVSEAGLADLEKAPGISKKMAKMIYGYFHG
jgi:excinuclease ABC subunit C